MCGVRCQANFSKFITQETGGDDFQKTFLFCVLSSQFSDYHITKVSLYYTHVCYNFSLCLRN